MHLQTMNPYLLSWHRKRGHPQNGQPRTKFTEKCSLERLLFRYSPGRWNPQGERGKGRSCFLYPMILPRRAHSVKGFFAVLRPKIAVYSAAWAPASISRPSEKA